MNGSTLWRAWLQGLRQSQRCSAFQGRALEREVCGRSTLVVIRPKGLTVCLAQPKELKVPQGWVNHCQMIPRANGLAVSGTHVTNGQTVGRLVRLRGLKPSPANLRFLGWARQTARPLALNSLRLALASINFSEGRFQQNDLKTDSAVLRRSDMGVN